MWFEGDVYSRIIDYIDSVALGDQIPGARDIARAVGCAPSYAHEVIKRLKK